MNIFEARIATLRRRARQKAVNSVRYSGMTKYREALRTAIDSMPYLCDEARLLWTLVGEIDMIERAKKELEANDPA